MQCEWSNSLSLISNNLQMTLSKGCTCSRLRSQTLFIQDLMVRYRLKIYTFSPSLPIISSSSFLLIIAYNRDEVSAKSITFHLWQIIFSYISQDVQNKKLTVNKMISLPWKHTVPAICHPFIFPSVHTLMLLFWAGCR